VVRDIRDRLSARTGGLRSHALRVAAHRVWARSLVASSRRNAAVAQRSFTTGCPSRYLAEGIAPDWAAISRLVPLTDFPASVLLVVRYPETRRAIARERHERLSVLPYRDRHVSHLIIANDR
jgi:hypothetical protein